MNTINLFINSPIFVAIAGACLYHLFNKWKNLRHEEYNFKKEIIKHCQDIDVNLHSIIADFNYFSCMAMAMDAFNNDQNNERKIGYIREYTRENLKNINSIQILCDLLENKNNKKNYRILKNDIENIKVLILGINNIFAINIYSVNDTTGKLYIDETRKAFKVKSEKMKNQLSAMSTIIKKIKKYYLNNTH